MADVRIHRYRVDAPQLEGFLRRRADVIAAIREQHPGFSETRLVRVGDDSFADIWRWRSAAEMEAGLAAPHHRGGLSGDVAHARGNKRGRRTRRRAVAQ